MNISRGKCKTPGCDVTWIESPDDAPVLIDAMRCRQKERTFYLAFLSAELVDVMCDVPAIPERIPYEDMADTCLSAMKEWQRPLDSDRVSQIGEFWRQLDNHLVNPPVIALRDSTEPDLEPLTYVGDIDPPSAFESWRMKIDTWMKSECPKEHQTEGSVYVDRCTEHGCDFHTLRYERPMIIIDGQHRLRGTQSAGSVSTELTLSDGSKKYASEVPVPVVILWSRGLDSFDYEKQAKIFTEITTQAEDLHYLHKLWLLYRFPGMMARIPELREMEQPITMDHATERGDRTRRAYEAILRACGTTMGASGAANPWRSGIPVVYITPYTRRVGSIDRLLPLVTKWFAPDGPLHGKPSGQAAAFLREYAKAIMAIWDRLSSQNRSYYWVPPLTIHRPVRANERGIISHPVGGQMSTWLRALLRLLPHVASKLPAGITDPGVGDIVNIIKPLSHCNLEGTGWEDFPGQEVRENLLFEILKDYLVGSTVKQEMKDLGLGNLNEYVDMAPTFELKVSGEGPPSGSGHPTVDLATTTISWRRPFNSFATAQLTLTQEGNPEPYVEKVNIDRGHSHDFVLKTDHYDPSLSGATIAIRVSYDNHKGTKSQLVEFETP